MQKRYAVQVKWALEQTEAALAPLAAKAMGIAPGPIEAVEITKQSIDARKGGVCFQVEMCIRDRPSSVWQDDRQNHPRAEVAVRPPAPLARRGRRSG